MFIMCSVGTRPQPHNKNAQGPAQSLQATVSAFARFFSVMQEQFKDVQIRHDQLSKQVAEDQIQYMFYPIQRIFLSLFQKVKVVLTFL